MPRRSDDDTIGQMGNGPQADPCQCPRHRIHLVIVSRRWKRRAFLDEVVHPRHAFGQVNIVGLDFTGIANTDENNSEFRQRWLVSLLSGVYSPPRNRDSASPVPGKNRLQRRSRATFHPWESRQLMKVS
jgi:hypothetical protein